MRTLADLLPRAAAAHLDAEGVVGLTVRWSWSDLDRATAALASALVVDGVQPGDRVVVARLKDAESFIAVHGILRAGAVVVPIDPFAPAEVARQVIVDAEPTAVVGDARTVLAFAPQEIDELDLCSIVVDGSILADGSIVVDGDDPRPRWRSWEQTLAHPPEAALPGIGPDDDAYIIYTSGSTGRPKGIVQTHASAMAYAERAVASHAVGPSDRIAGIPPLHFDQATFELFAAPLAGAAVVVMGEAHTRFPAALVERTEAERVTVWYSVPSLFRQLAERGGMDRRDLSSLRLVKFGGEVFPAGALDRLHDLVPRAALTNVYGPAEVNECTNHRVEPPVGDLVDIPIGRPWDGVTLRIVDPTGVEVAPGGRGELLVSGPTTMRGYWRRPDLTAAAITVDDDGRRWYATGDLVSADATGLLHFHGRADNQVKIRGVRIELEGVEAVVADGPGVAEAVVGPTPDHQSLIAAVVATPDDDLDEMALRRWCAARLPQVAVPGAFRVVDRLPTTPSGKVDRAAVRRTLALSPELSPEPAS